MMAYENGPDWAMVHGAPRRRPYVPLKDVRVDAKIVDVVAKMTVQQTFYNEEPNPIEAIYIFPLDTKAAVCQFSIRINDQTVHGGMEERTSARETYDLAISEGHGAFLLEQPMPDVFQISIGNLGPGEQADVTIAYLKFGDAEVDESEFPIPTWFSPRQRQSTQSTSFLAVEDRSEDRKLLGRMVTRKVPLAPAPGDYFYFGASVGPKFGDGRAKPKLPAEEEETVASAVTSCELKRGLRAHEEEAAEPVHGRSRDLADSSATLVPTTGTGSAHASAAAESQAVVERVIAEAVAESVAEVRGGGSADVTAEYLAKAVGSATATAVADALVTVNIKGHGIGPGMAEADAKAVAKVVAQAIPKAFAIAVGMQLYAEGVGRARVSETRLTQAIAHAAAEASSQDGSTEVSSTVMTDAVVEVVAETLAIALSSVADHAATADANAAAIVDLTDEAVVVDTFDEAKVSGESKAVGQGSGEAATSVLPEQPVDKKTSELDIRPKPDNLSADDLSNDAFTKKSSYLSSESEAALVDSVAKEPLSLSVDNKASGGKKMSGLPVGRKAAGDRSVTKNLATVPIGPQPSTWTQQAGDRPVGKKTSKLAIGQQSSSGKNEAPTTNVPPVKKQDAAENTELPTTEDSSGFEFRPSRMDEWSPLSGKNAPGDCERPFTNTTSNFEFKPQTTGWSNRPSMGGPLDVEEHRYSSKSISSFQFRPQQGGWPGTQPTWQPSGTKEEAVALHSPCPRSSKPTSGFQRFGSPPGSSTVGARVGAQRPGAATMDYNRPGSGSRQYSRHGYTIMSGDRNVNRQLEGYAWASSLEHSKDPVLEIVNLQEADGSFKLTQELCSALGFDLVSALMEYNVFRASLGEQGLDSATGAEPWAIALVLKTLELKMSDRKGDWQRPAFKAADLLAGILGENDFNAILNSAKMYLFRIARTKDMVRQ